MTISRALPNNKQILFLSLVCSIIASSLVYKLEVNATSPESERAFVGGDRLTSLDEPASNGLDFSIEENPLEDVVGVEDGEENEIAGGEPNKSGGGGQAFTWQHHRDDHGIYAGRSLLTSESSKPLEHSAKGEEENHDEDVEEVEGAHRNRARRRFDDQREDDPLKTKDFAEKEWQLMFRSFDSAYDSISSSILQEIGKQTNLFEEIVSKLKAPCRRDIHYVRDSIKKHKLWALRMVDSNGKLPSGITYGRFSSPGDYEECLSVQVDDKLYRDMKNNIVEGHKFHGKYCLLDFRLPLPERPRDKLLSVHESVLNFTGTEIGRLYPEMIGNFSAYASVFYEVGYLHGFCLPSSCDVKDLTKAMTKALEGMYLIVNNTVDCEERPPDGGKPIRTSQWISIILMAIVFVNAFLATSAYYLLPKEIREQANQQRGGGPPPTSGDNNNKNKGQTDKGPNNMGLHDTLRRISKLEESKRIKLGMQQKRGLRERLTRWSVENRFYSDCFSIQKNFERLTKPDPRGLTFVHYTRIVAMALTVITHTGALGTLQAITKPADASNSEQIFRDLIPQMLANAFTSIQIFFFMAGFMLVISTFPSIKRDKGHISFLEYAVKRAIRLMPGIAATICLNFIWPLLVEGPMLSYFDRMIVMPCEKTWWHTMGFVSNFDHVEKMCLRHSYFSASDYQLHMMAFPLLILLYKQPGLALFLAGILTVSGFVAQIIMILTKTVLPFMMVDYIDKEAFFNVVHYIHHPVWNHMSAFFYGFIVGYMVVRQIRIQLSPVTIKRIWFIMMPAGVASIFAPYFWNHYKRPIFKWQMVLYVIFDRFILLTTCAWLSYATMVLGRKPPAKKLPQISVARGSDAGKESDSGVMVSPIERVLGKTNQNKQATTTSVVVVPVPDAQRLRGLGGSSGSLTSIPRQRSSPNLAYLQHQQLHLDQPGNLLSPASGRLSRTTSSSNLETIAETTTTQKPSDAAPEGQASGGKSTGSQEQSPPKPRTNPAAVSNINTLCLVLSRLTFQLYLFNMVVLWIDVNHSKYYWFFSYYFIVFKAAAIYISSALLAMVFFVVLESPCLTLYIAWVKGRAVARSKRSSRIVTGGQPADSKMVALPNLRVLNEGGPQVKSDMDSIVPTRTATTFTTPVTMTTSTIAPANIGYKGMAQSYSEKVPQRAEGITRDDTSGEHAEGQTKM